MEGAKTRYIPDGFFPATSNGRYPSHEAICVLNTGHHDANVEITLYFEENEKMEGFHAVCRSEKTNHIRLDKLKNAAGDSVPAGIPYALMVRSDVAIIVQYSRMDTTQAGMALMTTMGYPVG